MTVRSVLFRADASGRIGSGHVIRCLTLANALHAQSADCVFAAAAMPESLADRIRAGGHQVVRLPEGEGPSDRAVEGTWTEPEQARDIAHCAEAMPGRHFDWAIVDHYGLDRTWESAARCLASNIMVIDDLANRPHDCDLLLDQNLGRKPADYESLVAPSARVLAGPRYALLRPEFAVARQKSLKRREQPGLSRLLISLGGSDARNVTGEVLRILDGLDLPDAVTITAVLGGLAGTVDAVRAQAAGMRHRTEILADVRDMASLMADCDLAIGAAGTTAWERCCLGLPSIVIVLAENQRPGAEALVRAGLAEMVCIEPQADFPAALTSAVEAALRGSLAPAVRRLVASGIDGNGCTRVVEELMGAEPGHRARLRKLKQADLGLVLEWRNSDAIRRHMLSQELIDYATHVAWFDGASKSRDRRLLILELDGAPAGYVHFKIDWTNLTATWGFYKAPEAPEGTGRILGRLSLDFAFERLGLHKVWAEVLPGNLASVRMHESLGFVQEGLLREAYKVAGEYADVAYYGLLSRDWKREL